MILNAKNMRERLRKPWGVGKRDDAGARAGCIGEEGQTRAVYRQVHTCIYRGEMNRMSVVNGRVTKARKGESARARYLQHGDHVYRSVITSPSASHHGIPVC